MKKPKSFIILSPGFPKDEADSSCLPAQQAFVLAVKNNFPGIRIIVISFQYPYKSEPYTWKGIDVFPFGGQGKGKIHRVVLWMKIWRLLRKLRSENDLVGILSFWVGECAFVGKHFAKRNKLKHLTWILGQDARKENNYVRMVKPKPAELVAMSSFLQQTFLENHGIKPMHIVPNAVDTSLYAVEKRTRDIDIMGAGSLIPLKQYDVFIRIVEKINKQFQVKAIICGKGPEEKKLRSMTRDLALNDTIELRGELEHGEILKLMQRSKIFLHTSSYEGFSSVCLEALYAGAQVISFCKPMESTVKHWSFVQTEDEMIQKAIEILEDANVDDGPVLLYSVQDTAKKIMGLFQIQVDASAEKALE